MPFLSSSVLQAINNFGNRLLQNIPVACPIIVPPGSEPYIWSICIDASKIGWWAIIRNPDDDIDDDDDNDAKNARILALSAVAHKKAHATDHKRSEN